MHRKVFANKVFERKVVVVTGAGPVSVVRWPFALPRRVRAW